MYIHTCIHTYIHKYIHTYTSKARAHLRCPSQGKRRRCPNVFLMCSLATGSAAGSHEPAQSLVGIVCSLKGLFIGLRGPRTCAVSIALGSVLVKIFGGCVHPPSAHLPCMKFPNCSRRDVWVGGWLRGRGGGGESGRIHSGPISLAGRWRKNSVEKTKERRTRAKERSEPFRPCVGPRR